MTRGNLLLVGVVLFSFLTAHCGKKPCGATCEPGDDPEPPTINTEKLIGTPFEGKTTGDDFSTTFFWCGDYRTETISSFPIKVFTAFFTVGEEEETIEDGIEIANTAIGFEVFELTEEWFDDNRVIYKVNTIDSTERAGGYTSRLLYYYDSNGLSERVVTDWTIEAEGTTATLIAHELGHATGLEHCLIDYTANSCDADTLEENSIMDGSGTGDNLSDYTFMMQKQGEIMLDHLNDTSGTLDTGNCGDE